MKLLRIFVVAVVALSATVAYATTAGAAGKAPKGNGLHFLVEDDYHFTNLACSDPAITDFWVARGGNAGWVVDGDHRMYVLAAISGEITATYPDSSQETYTFEQSMGKRLGQPERLTCTADFDHSHDGVTEEGVMTFVLARIW